MNTFCYIFLLVFSGWNLCQRVPFRDRVWMALPMGILAYTACVLGWILNPLAHASMGVSSLVGLLVVSLLYSWREKVHGWGFLTAMAFGCVALVGWYRDYTIFSPDSMIYMGIGRLAIGDKSALEMILLNFADWGVLPSLFFGGSGLFNEEYLPGLGWAIVVNIGGLVFSFLKGKGPALTLPAILAGAFFLCSPSTWVHANYISSNAIACLFATLAFFSAERLMEKDSTASLVTLHLGLLGFLLSRPDSSLFVAVILLGVALYGQKVRQRMRRVILPQFGICSLWLFCLFRWYSPHFDEILTPITIVLSGIPLLVAPLFMLLEPYIMKRGLLRTVQSGMLIVVGFALSGLFLLRPAVMSKSLESILYNVFLAGRWGYTAFGLVMTLVILKMHKRLLVNRFILFGLVYCLAGTWAIGFFREPYRVGVFDTANRMLFHWFPLLIVYLASVIESPVEKEEAR